MGLTLKKSSVYDFLFLVCIAVPYFNNYELTFAVWSLTILATIQRSYSLTFIKQFFAYTSIFLVAFFITFFKDHQIYYIIRDITYILKPVLGLLVGYQICKKSKYISLDILVKIGFYVAILHFIFLLRGILFFRIFDIHDLRFYGGYFSDYEVFILVLLIFHKKFELSLPSRKIRMYTLVIGFSVFLYLARTNFIQLAILILGVKGYLVLNKRSLTYLLSFIVLGLMTYALILYVNPKRNGPGIEAFLYKIKIIPEEAFKTRVNRFNWKDFNDNYRSYENIMTARQVSKDGFWSAFFGQGLGSKIDLKQKLYLGGMELRYISILHNGYMTVFLKSGFLGIIILLLSFGVYFKKYKTSIPLVSQINLLLIGMGVFMIFSYWVFMGFYFKADTKSILLGFLLAFREYYNRNQKLATTNSQKEPF